jgi:hypothetical protein
MVFESKGAMNKHRKKEHADVLGERKSRGTSEDKESAPSLKKLQALFTGEHEVHSRGYGKFNVLAVAITADQVKKISDVLSEKL